MTYPNVLSVATDPDHAMRCVAEAAALAYAWDAHLDVLCLGVDRTQAGYYYAGANAMVLQETLNRALDEARHLADTLRGRLDASGARWALDEGVAQLSDIGRHVAARARFADLVVATQPYGPGERGVELEPIVEGALFEGQAAVLVLPEDGPDNGADDTSVPPAPKRIAVAWNESPESMRAVRAALPLLKGADTVHIVVIDPPVHGPERSDPGGLLAQFLARHGVKAEIAVQSKTVPKVADVLNRYIVDNGIELAVMGAYGHSRFREAILGGATRDMLSGATVPVFMAH